MTGQRLLGIPVLLLLIFQFGGCLGESKGQLSEYDGAIPPDTEGDNVSTPAATPNGGGGAAPASVPPSSTPKPSRTGPNYTVGNPGYTPRPTPNETTPTPSQQAQNGTPAGPLPDYESRDPYDVSQEIPIGVQLCNWNATSSRGVDVRRQTFAWATNFTVVFALEGYDLRSDPRNDCAGWLFRVWTYHSADDQDLFYQKAGTGGLFQINLTVDFRGVRAFRYELEAHDGHQKVREAYLLFPPAPDPSLRFQGVSSGVDGRPGNSSHTFQMRHKFHDRLVLEMVPLSRPGDIDIYVYAPDGRLAASAAQANSTGPEPSIVVTDRFLLSQTGSWEVEVSPRLAAGAQYDLRITFGVPYAYFA